MRSVYSLVSRMNRTVLIGGGASAIATGIITAIDFVMTTSPNYPFSFGFGMLLMWPAAIVSRIFGVESSQSRSLWGWLEIGSNTFLAFAVGALVGWIIYRSKRVIVVSRGEQ